MWRWLWPWRGFSFSCGLTWVSDERVSMRLIFALILLAMSGAAAAQDVETRAQALADDAAQYAAQFNVSPTEAVRRLKAQQDSVAITDAIAREFAGRLAGISIEHSPDFRIVVLLTGSQTVADREASGIPIIFKTGATATHSEAIAALRRHLIDLRS